MGLFLESVKESNPYLRSFTNMPSSPLRFSPAPMIKWPQKLDYPKCDLLFNAQRTDAQKAAVKRVHTIDENHAVNMNCSDVRSRGYYPTTPLTDDEAAFPLAYATIVYEVWTIF